MQNEKEPIQKSKWPSPVLSEDISSPSSITWTWTINRTPVDHHDYAFRIECDGYSIGPSASFPDRPRDTIATLPTIFSNVHRLDKIIVRVEETINDDGNEEVMIEVMIHEPGTKISCSQKFIKSIQLPLHEYARQNITGAELRPDSQINLVSLNEGNVTLYIEPDA